MKFEAPGTGMPDFPERSFTRAWSVTRQTAGGGQGRFAE